MSFMSNLVSSISSVCSYSLNSLISSNQESKEEEVQENSLSLVEFSQNHEEPSFEIISCKPFHGASYLSNSETLIRTQRISYDMDLVESNIRNQEQDYSSKIKSPLSGRFKGVSVETAIKENMNKKITYERALFTPNGVINIYKKIGKGSFGNVYKALFMPKYSTDVEYVAIKVSRVFECEKSTLESFISVKEESEFLSELSELDPFDFFPTMKMKCCGSLDSNIYYIIQPLCEMSLHEYIYRSSLVDITIPKVKSIIKQIFKALAYISSSCHVLIHADIKPGNILIESIEPIKIRVADFGSSLRGVQENLESDYAVTRYYRPPEIFLGKPFDHKVDVWSAGCVAAEILFRSPLFPAERHEQLLPMYVQFLGSMPAGVVKSSFQIPRYLLLENGHYILKSGAKSSFFEHRMQFFEKNIEIIKDRICLDRSSANIMGQLLEMDLFREFIFGALTWTPDARFSASQALDHRFLKES